MKRHTLLSVVTVLAVLLSLFTGFASAEGSDGSSDGDWRYTAATDSDGSVTLTFDEIAVVLPADWAEKVDIVTSELGVEIYHSLSRRQIKDRAGSDDGGLLLSVCCDETEDYRIRPSYFDIGTGTRGNYFLAFPTDFRGDSEETAREEYIALWAERDFVKANSYSLVSQEERPRPILYTYYRQLGWGDRVHIGYVDSEGDCWFLTGHDAGLHWPYAVEDQLQYLTEHTFRKIGAVGNRSDLSDLKSLVLSVKPSDERPHSAANDAGTESTYAVRYDRDGNAKLVLLGMSGDDAFENMDPNAQSLYLSVRTLLPDVHSYFGIANMGPLGFPSVPLTAFCRLGDLENASVKAVMNDCEAGPYEIELTAEDEARIVNAVRSSSVTGKVNAVNYTGGFITYSFFTDGEPAGSIDIYQGKLYCPDGLYALSGNGE